MPGSGVCCAMRGLKLLLFLALLFGVVGCDHTTKHVARSQLATSGPLELVPGLLELRYVTNTDTAFSILGGHLGADVRFLVIILMQLAVTVAILVWISRRWQVAATLERAAGAVLLGGALGNLLDRLVRGHVVDFIHLKFWPVFNVADIAICVGVGLFWLATRAHSPQEPAG